MLVVGLTGGIASGKSTVSGLIKSYGIPIIDLDQLARKVVEPGSTGLRKIQEHFSDQKDIINSNNQTLNRDRLGQIIFNDPNQRKWLDGLLHPIIRRLMVFELVKFWLSGHKICVIDSPLLIETGMWKFCGKVILVYCSEQIQIQRLKLRNQLTTSEAKSRILSQLPLKSKLTYADHIIDNSGNVIDLEHQIQSLIHKFQTSNNRLIWLLNWLIPPIGLLNGLLLILWKVYLKPIQESSRKRKNRHYHHHSSAAERSRTRAASTSSNHEQISSNHSNDTIFNS